MSKHVIIVVKSLDLDARSCIERGLPSTGYLVLEGRIREDGNCYVGKVVDSIDTTDTRVANMGFEGEGNIDLLSFQKSELLAHHLAEASAELYGALHLLTFTGEVIFN